MERITAMQLPKLRAGSALGIAIPFCAAIRAAVALGLAGPLTKRKGAA
jgi:hypothetical protein